MYQDFFHVTTHAECYFIWRRKHLVPGTLLSVVCCENGISNITDKLTWNNCHARSKDCEEWPLASPCLSVHQRWTTSAPTGRIFVKCVIWILSENLSIKLKFHQSRTRITGILRDERGTAVAQWLRCCATNRKVPFSILAGVSESFIVVKLFR